MKIMGKTIAERVRFIRAQLDLTQAELAERSGISFRGLQTIESGKSIPGTDSLTGIAKAAGVTIDELVGTPTRPTSSFLEAAAFLDKFANRSPKWQQVVQALLFDDLSKVQDPGLVKALNLILKGLKAQ